MIPYDQAIKQIKQGQVANIYLLLGTEYYFIEEFKRAFLAKLSEQVEEVNEYDLREVAIQDVIIDLETLPFFSDKNIVFAEHPTFLRANSEKVSVNHDLTKLEQYLHHPAPYSNLIIIAPYERLDRRKTLTKTVMKHATVVDCQPIRDFELGKWIDQLLQGYNIEMTDLAKERIEAEFGTNLYLLQKEIEKIAIYIGDHGKVDEAALMDIMSSSLEQSALELTDAVLRKDLSKAIAIYKELEKMNENPIGMIALLAYQFRMMLQVKLLVEGGMSFQEIKGKVKAHPFVVKKAYERSHRYERNALQAILDELAQTDYRIKSGFMDKGIAFELLLYRLIRHSEVGV